MRTISIDRIGEKLVRGWRSHLAPRVVVASGIGAGGGAGISGSADQFAPRRRANPIVAKGRARIHHEFQTKDETKCDYCAIAGGWKPLRLLRRRHAHLSGGRRGLHHILGWHMRQS